MESPEIFEILWNDFSVAREKVGGCRQKMLDGNP